MCIANGKDVHISAEEMAGHPTLQPYKPKPVPSLDTPSSTTGGSSDPSLVGGVKTVSMTVEFVCSAADLYDTLLKPERAQVWTRAPAVIAPTVGCEYSLFGGNVVGKIVELVPNKKIVKTWRLKSWPAGKRLVPSHIFMIFMFGLGLLTSFCF
jgi:activator of HSP90 ATPase